MNTIQRYKPAKVQYFSWSLELAYAVGLITTDGCLSSDGRHITFTSNDLEQIRNIKLILKIKNKIGITKNHRSETFRVQFSNVQMYDWLLSIGLTPHKSLTLGNIIVPDIYFIDFLRGHLDGDGSISTYTDHYNAKKNPRYVYNRIFVKFISASKNHTEWLQNKIINLLGVQGAFHATKKAVTGKQNVYS